MSDVQVDWNPELEEWTRRTDDHLLAVSAGRLDLDGSGVLRRAGVDVLEPSWTVSVAMAEFIRSEPLEGEMRSSFDRALRRVPGVERVWEEDRECWAVTGDPDGADLVRAVGEAVDRLALTVRAELGSLDRREASGIVARITSWARSRWR